MLLNSNMPKVTKIRDSSRRDEAIFFQKLGRRVAQRRVSLKLTQTTLARRSGIDRSQLSLLEIGQRHPTLRTLRTAAQALRTSLSELLRGL